MENHNFLKVYKPSINEPFSMAMLNNQRVYIPNGPAATEYRPHLASWLPPEPKRHPTAKSSRRIGQGRVTVLFPFPSLMLI